MTVVTASTAVTTLLKAGEERAAPWNLCQCNRPAGGLGWIAGFSFSSARFRPAASSPGAESALGGHW